MSSLTTGFVVVRTRCENETKIKLHKVVGTMHGKKINFIEFDYYLFKI